MNGMGFDIIVLTVLPIAVSLNMIFVFKNNSIALYNMTQYYSNINYCVP